MELIPNTGVVPSDAEEWRVWNETIGALHAATGGDPRGLEAAHMWSQKSPKYNVENTNDRWEHLHSYPFDRKGAGSIIYWANEVDPDCRTNIGNG